MIDTKWKDRNYAKAYELARQGLKESEIAKFFGVSPDVFRQWKKDKTELPVVLRRGRAEHANDRKYKDTGKLSPKQQAFVDEYLKDFSVGKAAARAGFSEKTAHVQGSKMLALDVVSKAVEAAIAKRTAGAEVEQERILQELACIAFSDPRRLFDSNGCLKDMVDLDEVTARSLKSIEVTSREDKEGEVTTTAKLSFWDKVSGLKLFMEHKGMLGVRGGVGIHQHVHLESQEKDPFEGADPELILKAKSALAKLKHSIEDPVTLESR